MTRAIFWALLIAIFTVGVATAQDSACPDLVAQALTTVGNSCAGLGRNQVCYGNFHVSAEAEPGQQITFAAAGDKTSVTNLASLTTFPLDPSSKAWGIAVMALQANLPDTLPGQNVTFVVFGNVTLNNDVSPDAPRLTGTAKGTANIRTGPGTGFSRADSLKSGDALTVVGRVQAGNWLQVLYGDDNQSGWVTASLVDVQGDVSTLNVVDPGPAYTNPMQAFRIHTNGGGATSCDNAPPDGVLIQAPEGLKVNFLINGIEVSMASTVLIESLEGDTIRVINLSGHVSVRTANKTVDLTPAQSIDVTAGTAPATPTVYSQKDVLSLPFALLPSVPSVPPVITGVLTTTIVGNGTPQLIPITFVNADGDAIVTLHQKFISSTAGTAPSGDQPITPANYESPYGGKLGYAFICSTNHTIRVTYQISIQDAAGNDSPPVRYTIVCTPP